MGYTQGVVRGSSVAMLIFSIMLLSFYIGCSNSCRFASRSFYSPVWTSLWGIAIGALGIQMSRIKAEKRWGGYFLTLCILCIFVSLGCMVLSLTAFFFELLDTQLDSSSSSSRFDPTPTSPQVTSYSGNRDVAIALWLCMMGTAGVMMIISIVSSCMFCCCQEPPQQVVNETRLVLTNGISPAGQTIVLNNQEFVLQPAAPGSAIIVTGVPSALQDQPPPYSSVINKPLNTPSGPNIQTASLLQNQFITRNAPYPSGAPVAPMPGGYMELQLNGQNQQPSPAASQEYSYADNNDSALRGRERILTPDEIYDEVGLPDGPQQHTGDQTYTYANPEDHAGQSQPQDSGETIDDGQIIHTYAENLTSQSQPTSGDTIDDEYSYTDNFTSQPRQLTLDENTQYANDGVRRSPRNNPNPTAPLPPVPAAGADYLEILE